MVFEMRSLKQINFSTSPVDWKSKFLKLNQIQ